MKHLRSGVKLNPAVFVVKSILKLEVYRFSVSLGSKSSKRDVDVIKILKQDGNFFKAYCSMRNFAWRTGCIQMIDVFAV